MCVEMFCDLAWVLVILVGMLLISGMMCVMIWGLTLVGVLAWTVYEMAWMLVKSGWGAFDFGYDFGDSVYDVLCSGVHIVHYGWGVPDVGYYLCACCSDFL